VGGRSDSAPLTDRAESPFVGWLLSGVFTTLVGWAVGERSRTTAHHLGFRSLDLKVERCILVTGAGFRSNKAESLMPVLVQQ
jgi:hypothetical protein